MVGCGARALASGEWQVARRGKSPHATPAYGAPGKSKATEQDKGEKQIPPATAGRHQRSPKAGDRVRDDNLGAHTPGQVCEGGTRPGKLREAGLDCGDVLGLETLGTLADFKFDQLPFVQGLVAVHLDRGEVHENIFTRLALNESVPFGSVKPLDDTLFSGQLPDSLRSEMLSLEGV